MTTRRGQRKESGGFTLLELMIVIIILGILASVAIPQFTKSVRRSRTGEAKANISALRGSEMRYFNEWGAITSSLGSLDIENPNNVTGARFSYVVSGSTLADMSIVATGLAGPMSGITVTYSGTSGDITEAGI